MGTDVAIGMAGSVSWHLGMVGHGNNSGSGPQPVVLLKNDSDGGDSAPQWEMPPSVKGYYRFFDHATTLPPLDDDKAGYFQFAETIDGTPDGLWRGKDVGSLEGGWASPARIPYQHQAIKSLIVQEEFGHHNETDLLFINYKVIDEIGHRYYASSDEMGDCVKAQDLFLQYFVNFLDKQVGVGEWLMLVTADHGHTAAPGVSGGYLINQHEVQRRIEALRSNPADPALLTQVRPMWLNIDDDELANSNLTYQDISKLIASLTRQQTRTTDDPSWTLTDEPVFDAAFAGSLLPHLSCWHPPAH
jgi:predicted AlkP superfamily pyrophosphatase or phosphodiesterase